MSKHFFYVTIVLLFTSMIAVAQPSKALEGLVKKMSTPYLEEETTHQLQIGILERGYKYHYLFEGTENVGKEELDSTALFAIGSITKTFTTALLTAMVVDKVVKLEDPITLYLPDSVTLVNSFLEKITLEELASHTSGFPQRPQNLALKMQSKGQPYANYELSDLHQYLIDYRPILDKKRLKSLEKKFLYSHFGIGLLGHLLEVAGKESYPNLLQKYLLQSLGLKSAKLLENISAEQNRLKGHDFSGNETLPEECASLYASEGLYISLPDLLQFVKVNMEESEQFSFLRTNLEAKCKTDKKRVQMGLGWFIIEQGNPKKYPPIYTHSAKTNGFSSYVGFIPKTQTAVVVLSNSNKRVDQLGISILELINR
ncbi:MAG: serine hydrolase domain-containing protein [Chitinophagales bacterium]